MTGTQATLEAAAVAAAVVAGATVADAVVVAEEAADISLKEAMVTHI
jgi:hypothetical protein